MIRIGIIGTGGIADMHARGIRGEPDRLQLVSACDINAEHVRAFGARHDLAEIYTDYQELLERSAVDAVIITLPHHLHVPSCIAAFGLGKHVLLEKPIARTLGEADTILASAKASGKTLMIGLNERYTPVHQQIAAMVQAGALGELFCAHADHYQDFDPPAGSWWRSAEAVGGGCTIGSGIHRLDLLRWYLGEVEEVFAYQTHDPRRLEAEVASTTILKFRSGAIGEFLCNWGIYKYPYCESISLSGRLGTIRSDDSYPRYLLLSRQGDHDSALQEIRPEKPFDSMWRHFAHCVESGDAPLTSGQEGRRSLELVLAIDQAARTGAPVRLSPIPAG